MWNVTSENINSIIWCFWVSSCVLADGTMCDLSTSLCSISTEHSPKLQIRSHSYLRAVSEVSINRSMESLDPKALLASPQYRSRNESYMRAMSTISQVCGLRPLTNTCSSISYNTRIVNIDSVIFAPEGERGGGERSDRGCVWKRLQRDGVSGGRRAGFAGSRMFPDAESQLRTRHRSGLLAGRGRTVTACVTTTDHHHGPDHSEQHRSEYAYSVYTQAKEFTSWSSCTCTGCVHRWRKGRTVLSVSARDPN